MILSKLYEVWHSRKVWCKKAAPYFGIPLFTIILFFILHKKQDPTVIMLQEILLVYGYCASISDLRNKTVPNNLIKWMLYSWVLVVVPQLFVRTSLLVPYVISGLLGSMLGGILLLIVYLMSHKGLGGGDVKFMAVSGLYLGIYRVFAALLYGSILSATIGIILVLLRRMHTKDTIPLIPFLYAGIIISVLIQQEGLM